MPRKAVKTVKKEGLEAKQPTQRACGTMQVHERLLRTSPGYREARDTSENHAMRASMSPLLGRSGCTKIPVVVHVVHKTAAQNISDAQIKSQIDVLTKDFRKTNSDVSTVPAAFAGLAADTRIIFELAKTDPSGNPTNGITRNATNVNAFSDDDAVKSAATGGANPWPSDKYLNIWVCQLGGGLLGYAQFPGGPAATDGVVILHSGFGTSGTAAAPFNLGRTATHEVGHWLNLRHIWGDDGTGCSGSDFIADTPNQGGPNFGTPAFPHVSCGNAPNGDMFMNYMDYVDDKAMVMFTTGQMTRMQATLDGLRSAMGTTTPCGKIPVKELPKDLTKEPHKDFAKDGVKDFAKDPPKESPKDPPKDWPKDPPKEWIKEFHKEFIKEFAKDFIKDPPKDVVKNFASDLPPKSFSDPPKSFMEPPIDFPGGIFGPITISPFTQPGQGGMPFTLATGAAAGAGPQFGQRQQTGTLANAYQQLLALFANLHAAGQLDAAGVAAWQEAAATYQRLAAAGA